MSKDNITKFLGAYGWIYLDFHNPDFLRDVGKDFKAEEYANTLREANVNGLVTFSKYHNGNSYWRTNTRKDASMAE